MIDITFSNEEVSSLKEFYKSELEKAINRVSDIKEMISKLDGKLKSEPKKRGLKAKATTTAKKTATKAVKSTSSTGKRRGRPAKVKVEESAVAE